MVRLLDQLLSNENLPNSYGIGVKEKWYFNTFNGGK
mgnify:CR=1 FL=1